MQIDLPQWMVWTVAILVLVGTMGGIFVIVRSAAIITKSYLILIKMTATLERFDKLSSVIFDLANQFKNDSGSSALDKIDALRDAGILQAQEVVLIKAALGNLRAEQTRLAQREMQQPATTQTVHIGGDAVGNNKTVGS